MKDLKGTRTEANLMAAFAGESQARNKYTYYVSKAKKDGYVQNSFYDLHTHIDNMDISTGYNMLEEIYDVGVPKINIACINYQSYSPDVNLRALYYKMLPAKAQISVFGGFYYNAEINHWRRSFLDQANMLLDLGCDGIKLIENKPSYRRYIGFGLDSKIYDKAFDMLEEKQIPILCHVNDPDIYWDRSKLPKGIVDRGWCYDTPEYLSYEEIYSETFARLDKNPDLKIIFAHFMFLSEDLERASSMLDKYPNVCLDLTPGWEMYVGFSKRITDYRDFFIKYSDRIYYGTDTHCYPIEPMLKVYETIRRALSDSHDEFSMPHKPEVMMRGMNLPEDVKSKIYRDNFDKLIGIPKPVNTDLWREEAQYILKLLECTADDIDAISRIRQMLNNVL